MVTHPLFPFPSYLVGVPEFFCFFGRVRGSGDTGVGVGFAPGGVIGGGCLDCWGVEGWCSILCFPFRVITAGVPGSLCVFAWTCGGGAIGFGGGIFPGDAGDVGCLEPWDVRGR